MSEDLTAEDRTEEPTARRLQKAREEGESARSVEVPAAGVMISGMALIFFTVGDMATQLRDLFAAGLVFDRATVSATNSLPGIAAEHVAKGYLIIAPVLLVTVVAAILFSGLTGGFLFSMKSAAPNMAKLNIFSGLKRIFGFKSAIELIKSLAKTVVVFAAVWWVINHHLDALLQLGTMAIEPALIKTGQILTHTALTVVLSLVLIAGIDAFYQRYEFHKRMRMSKQEVRDEMKDSEGRPEVRAQIRRRQREMATRRMMDRVKDADVIITNPEHFAVALSYDPTREGAPILLAKGVDALAFRIIDEARKQGVFIMPVPPLARALYFTTKLDHPIPEALYYAVARVIAYVFSLNSLNPGMAQPARPEVEIPDEMRFDSEGHLETAGAAA